MANDCLRAAHIFHFQGAFREAQVLESLVRTQNPVVWTSRRVIPEERNNDLKLEPLRSSSKVSPPQWD